MRRLTLALCVTAAAVVAGLAATSAFASAYGTLSFFTSGDGSAAWAGTPNKHTAVQLTASNTGGSAGVQLNHVSATAPADAPTFTTDHYAAGSPRMVIEFAGGGVLFGYPSPFNEWEAADCPAVAPNNYTDYTTALGELQATSCGGNVTAVFVVADDSSGQPTETDSITSLVYDGTAYIG